MISQGPSDAQNDHRQSTADDRMLQMYFSEDGISESSWQNFAVVTQDFQP